MITENIIKTVLNKIFNLNKEEKFLIITDNIKKQLAEDFFIYSIKNGYDIKLILMEELKQTGEEPSDEISEEMLKSDVILMLTNKSLSHTEARRKATKKGARIISAPGITEDILDRCVDIDYDELIKTHKWLRPIIANSKEIKVTSSLGTEITFSVQNTHGYAEHLLKHDKGAFGNLPSGEVDSGVINANGKIVINGSLVVEEVILENSDITGEMIKDSINEVTRNAQQAMAKKMMGMGFGS